MAHTAHNLHLCVMCAMCAIVFEIHGTALACAGLVWPYIYIHTFFFLLIEKYMAHMTHKGGLSEGRILSAPLPTDHPCVTHTKGKHLVK